MSNIENIEKLKSALGRLEKSESIVYFLTYDTKNNARASIKYIYDMAKTLNENGIESKILVEDKSYTGVKSWLGDEYDNLSVVSIKDDKVEIKVDDIKYFDVLPLIFYFPLPLFLIYLPFPLLIEVPPHLCIFSLLLQVQSHAVPLWT